MGRKRGTDRQHPFHVEQYTVEAKFCQLEKGNAAVRGEMSSFDTFLQVQTDGPNAYKFVTTP